ncbi:MAG: N-acetylmuramoyl-L-alanine amidase, partial [Thermomicrobiales bacterium]
TAGTAPAAPLAPDAPAGNVAGSTAPAHVPAGAANATPVNGGSVAGTAGNAAPAGGDAAQSATGAPGLSWPVVPPWPALAPVPAGSAAPVTPAPVPSGIIWIGTLNWHERTGGQQPEAIVYHVTDDLVFGNVRSHFTNLASQASAHFVVGREGELWQFVPTRHAAWTNGDYANWRRDIPWLQEAIARCQRGERNLNDFTCNIEFMGKPGLPFTPAQFDRAVEITRYLLDRYPRIQPHRGRMLRHADINGDTRPYCPGPTFPLRELILAVGGDPEGGVAGLRG